MNDVLIFPSDFKTKKVAIHITHDMAFNIEELCKANNVSLWNDTFLLEWLRDRIAEKKEIYLYWDRTYARVSCFTGDYWGISAYDVLEVEDVVQPVCYDDILDLLE